MKVMIDMPEHLHTALDAIKGDRTVGECIVELLHAGIELDAILTKIEEAMRPYTEKLLNNKN